MANTEQFSCLLVDDDVGFTSMLAKIVKEEGGRANCCHTVAAAQEQIARAGFDVIILDNCLPDGSGYDFYSQVGRHSPASVVAMITGAPELSQAIELTRNGLFDYLTKPIDASAFAALLRRAKLRLRRPALESLTDGLLGNSQKMHEVVLQLEQAARHLHATVLLLGETGTGKDLAARFLHQLTFANQPKAPYVALNCPNVPADMFEAELFGSEKGAYTGADRRRGGLAEAAEGGTLFLDEVAEIPLALQSKLLRFLETREYRALGGTNARQFQGRVVAATNRKLADEVRAGRFREDLLYRLDVFSVHLPPLREHISDLEAIAEALLGRLCEKYGRSKPALRASDLNALKGHLFPGNVRELRNLLERSLLRTDALAHELAMDLEWLKGYGHAVTAMPLEAPVRDEAAKRSLSPLERQEYELIAKTLASENGGIRRAAAKLGLTHQALLRRLQKWPELRQGSNPGVRSSE
ncbi:MAG TPA: sigma-54 dependent transcriptional regulator [Candidatus Limnocylindrales bacterium]|nr:sigma-54 dependent transcriptional regulator [Candidatus Limnocylindrales bacterium]